MAPLRIAQVSEIGEKAIPQNIFSYYSIDSGATYVLILANIRLNTRKPKDDKLYRRVVTKVAGTGSIKEIMNDMAEIAEPTAKSI